MAVMDGKALTVTEIVPRTGFYDYEAKYGEGGSTHVVPAQIPAARRRKGPATWPSSRTPRLVAAALPEATFVMTTLTTFWSFWRSTPSPA